MIFTESGYIQWMYCYITAGVYLNDFSHLSLKRRYQIHAMKPQTAFEVKPVFGGQKNGGYKPKETGITQPTYPCGAAVREMWVLREVVMDDCEWRQLIWKGCCWHPTSRVLFTEWKNPVVMRGLCVLSSACEAEGKPCQQGEGWGGELRHSSSQMWRWFYSLTRHCSGERGCQRAPGSKILHLPSMQQKGGFVPTISWQVNNLYWMGLFCITSTKNEGYYFSSVYCYREIH